MSEAAAAGAEAACLASLEVALGDGRLPDLTGVASGVLERALQSLAKQHGAAAAPLLRLIADQAPGKEQRKAARRVIYRLTQAGIAVPPPPASSLRPVVTRKPEKPVGAWLSGIDGTGSRAVWILFEGGVGGGLLLCSLILNDEVGILEATGGPITRKRLERQLGELSEQQTLGWVESNAARARALVGEALALHARAGTQPPQEFSPWRRLFDSQPAVDAEPPDTGAPPGRDVDGVLLDQSAELLELPELMGWFVDPASIQEEGLALLQARESRLVVSEQIKAEREAAIVDAVIDKHFTAESRRRWARRLTETALIFRAASREEPARLADTAAAALAYEDRPARAIPLVRALALRGIEMAAEVTLGRARLGEVSRAPQRPRRP